MRLCIVLAAYTTSTVQKLGQLVPNRLNFQIRLRIYCAIFQDPARQIQNRTGEILLPFVPGLQQRQFEQVLSEMGNTADLDPSGFDFGQQHLASSWECDFKLERPKDGFLHPEYILASESPIAHLSKILEVGGVDFLIFAGEPECRRAQELQLRDLSDTQHPVNQTHGYKQCFPVEPELLVDFAQPVDYNPSHVDACAELLGAHQGLVLGRQVLQRGGPTWHVCDVSAELSRHADSNIISQIQSMSKHRLMSLAHSSNTLLITARPVGYKSRHFKAQLTDLRNLASQRGVCSLSANQIGCLSNFFICLPKNKLVNNKWQGYNAPPNEYQPYVNPQITKSSLEMLLEEERCCSLPGLGFKVSRSKNIQIIYQEENMTKKQQELAGFLARVCQHEVDHLAGILLIDIIKCEGRLRVLEGAEDMSKGEIDRLVSETVKMKEEDKIGAWKKVTQLAKFGVMEPAFKTHA